MKRIAIVGKIGAGKSFVASNFGLPVFNADHEVDKIYKKDKNCFLKLKSKLPRYIKSFPIDRKELIRSILNGNKNLGKIINIIHPIVRKKLRQFLKKNKNKKAIILDIPLYFENKLNKKNDIVIFVDAKDKDIRKRLKKRPIFNTKIINQLRKIQLKSNLKKKNSNYIIKNDFKNLTVKNKIKILKNQIF